MLADQLDLIYPKNYYSFDEGGEKNVVIRVKEWLDARLLRKILRTIPGNTIRVLDVGGGTGWLSSLVRGIDPRITFTQIVDLDSRAGLKLKTMVIPIFLAGSKTTNQTSRSTSF
jgi:hypothetical protein